MPLSRRILLSALEATMSENAHLRVSIARFEAQVKGMQMAMLQEAAAHHRASQRCIR